MRALVFEQGKAELRDVARPAAEPGWAVLRVRLAGICNTDVELLRGYYGFSGIPGHEFTAEVVEAPGHEAWIGKRVTAEINVGCGTCPGCVGGDPRHCPERRVIGIRGLPGAFADYLTVPVANLVELPPELDDIQAVFAEPLAAALQTAETTEFRPTSRVAVLGDGKLGVLCALALARLSPDLTLIGRHERKLDIVRRVGGQAALTSRDESGAELAGRLGQFDIVVEATGSPQGLDAALELVRPGGVIAAKTTAHLPSGFNLARLVVNEVRISGSRCGRFAPALEYLRRGWVDPRPLLDGTCPASDALSGLEAARRPGAGKVLLDWRG